MVEVSRREFGVSSAAAVSGGQERVSYIQVKGFKLTQFANWPRCGAIELRKCDHWILVDNEVTWSNGVGIEIDGSNMILRRNVSSHTGQLGIGGGV